MEIYERDEFFSKTRGGRPNRSNMTPYIGKPFECACGKIHNFDDSFNVVRELSGMRFVIACPEKDYVTCVKITGSFRFKFESLFGCGNDEWY